MKEDGNANEGEEGAFDEYEKRWMKALGITDGDETFSEEYDEEFSDDGCEGDSVHNDDECDDMEEDEEAIDGGLGGLGVTVED